jgi:hypothetical protein
MVKQGGYNPARYDAGLRVAHQILAKTNLEGRCALGHVDNLKAQGPGMR